MQFGPDFLVDVLATYANLLQNIVEFAVIALGLYVVGRALVETVGRIALQRSKFDETMADGVLSFLRLAVVLLAVVVGASAADFRGAFAGSALIAGGVTLAVGLGAQDVLGNFVAGAFLVQDPDVNIGDRIRWEDEEGIITGIDLRVTRVRTLDNEIIVVPNSELSTTVVRNLTSHNPVGFSYEFAVQHDEIDEAVATIETVAAEYDELVDVPAPTVRVTDLLESEVVVTARAFFPIEKRSQRYRIRTTFLRRVVQRCQENGVGLSQSTLQELSGKVGVDPVAVDEGGPADSDETAYRSTDEDHRDPD
ncbi:mechanosensitive ion channel family protein [Halobacteria archaeon HArc-gm2]|nr:mechanosensitive ion channel family protein [Halobacteria archaeon HArc-gm2]